MEDAYEGGPGPHLKISGYDECVVGQNVELVEHEDVLRRGRVSGTNAKVPLDEQVLFVGRHKGIALTAMSK
jgi:hypothetical protein